MSATSGTRPAVSYQSEEQRQGEKPAVPRGTTNSIKESNLKESNLKENNIKENNRQQHEREQPTASDSTKESSFTAQQLRLDSSILGTSKSAWFLLIIILVFIFRLK